MDQCGESLLYFHQLVLPLLRKPPPPTSCSCSSCYTMACSIPITLHHASSISLPPVESLKQQACLSASERRGCPSALTAIHHQPHHPSSSFNSHQEVQLLIKWQQLQQLHHLQQLLASSSDRKLLLHQCFSNITPRQSSNNTLTKCVPAYPRIRQQQQLQQLVASPSQGNCAQAAMVTIAAA